MSHLMKEDPKLQIGEQENLYESLEIINFANIRNMHQKKEIDTMEFTK